MEDSLCLFVVCLFAVWCARLLFPFFSATGTVLRQHGHCRIPKIIWTYEPFTHHPPTDKTRLRKQIREEWKRHLPDYEIIVLDEKNAHHYVRIPAALLSHPPAVFSELVCLYALAEHGGLWMDSTVRLRGPLPDALFPKRAEGAVFSLSPSFLLPTVIACQAQSEFLSRWRDAYATLLSHPSRDHFLDAVKKQGVSLPDFLSLLEYIPSVAGQLAQQTYPMDDRWIRWSAETHLFSLSSSLPLEWTPPSEG